MTEKYTEQVFIPNFFTDKAKCLRIKTVCDLFNDIAQQHTIRLGTDVDTINPLGFTWMLRQLHIAVQDMPKRWQTVTLDTWCAKINGLLVERDYRFSLAGVPLVSANSKWMYIDFKERRPLRPTELMYNCAALNEEKEWQYPSLFSRKESKGDFSEMLADSSLQWHLSDIFTANYNDIDFNGHVTQSSYVQWMMNVLSFEFFDTHKLKEIETIYAHEIMPSGKAIVQWNMSKGDIATFLIKSENGNTLHCWGRAVFN
ncbi:MAG: acyl-ACP thioesterase [Bacteroidales bacterium]|jgi:acyl-ACP thioesterase|nr:acyl-ACP thioesterase [Bacteroidales bacterium]